ncbi:receptor-like protein EIX1 [Diospyros lotus]|uniref:receptor-like protein EIX1 n=1 Tax=Diospyros lotus TaxID=55363 RepID=UPI00224D08EC|nr:receptor-like protein EIX1 [Diospyros lotus]
MAFDQNKLPNVHDKVGRCDSPSSSIIIKWPPLSPSMSNPASSGNPPIVTLSSMAYGIISLQIFLLFVGMLHCIKSSSGLPPGGGDSSILCFEKERQALLKIKAGIVDEYGYLSSWATQEEDMDCCKWGRIKCNNRTGHVVRLDLHSAFGMPMTGELNTSMLELQHLDYLDLSSSAFRIAPSPNLLGSFSKLRYLNLSKVGLNGNFPYEIGNLSGLVSLDLSRNNFVRVETLGWLSRLPSLSYLDISVVNLSKAANWLQEISMLPSLTYLSLYFCSLHDPTPPIPSLSNLSRSLQTIDLSANFLTPFTFSWLPNMSTNAVDLKLMYCFMNGPIPDVFWNMTSLAHLDLSYNKFKGGIPKTFGNLCSLKTLDLSKNSLNQSLSDSIDNLYTQCSADPLEVLSLKANRFIGTLPDFTRFSSLRELYLDMNKLNGSIPESFGQLSSLQLLNIQDNQLSGSLPYFPESLVELFLSNNQLDGSLFKSINKLPYLIALYVSSNKLADVITQAQLMNFSYLEDLVLSHNSFSFNISSRWVPPFQLQIVGLSSCQLGGQFPAWLQGQKSISHLDISNNGISGTIPSWLSQLTPTLMYLNLSYNQVSGTFGAFVSDEPFVVVDLSFNHFEGLLPLFSATPILLDLSHNMFSGSISSICSMTTVALNHLDLSNNMLSGSIPDCWERSVPLYVLRLANNNFTGEIPASIGSLLLLYTLHLQNNSLTGGLPMSIKNCTSLTIMDVGGNRLSGEVPAWIGDDSLLNLIVLNLRSNAFSGSIPSQLCYRQTIRILDLSQNNISGTIPSCISNFSVMAQEDSSGTPIIYKYLRGYVENRRDIGYYLDNVSVTWKGRGHDFGKNLGLLKVIDLSSNSLSGVIPDQVTSLLGLVGLNLSRNHLTGTIPPTVGRLSQLQSLDLSRNHLSGEIPAAMGSLSFLQYLDLSNNDFSGRVPSGTQLQSFNASAYSGNPKLCGPPLVKKCREDAVVKGSPSRDKDTDEESGNWNGIPVFYITGVIGFAVGFWGVFFTLALKRSWRAAYFRFFKL